MQDRAPSQSIVKAGINHLHSHNAEVLGWPGNSPNMNQIDNIWKEIKDCVYKLLGHLPFS
jgi:hypothetical protein